MASPCTNSCLCSVLHFLFCTMTLLFNIYDSCQLWNINKGKVNEPFKWYWIRKYFWKLLMRKEKK